MDRILTQKNIKYMTLLSLFALGVLLLPVVYLSFLNRASGDDYGYGIYTRAAWMGTHSLIELGKAIYLTVRQFYGGWQGT